MKAVNKQIVLFAEDIVSHLMNKVVWKSTSYTSINVAPRMGEYRQIIYAAFNETVRRAVDILYDSLSCSIQSRYNDIPEEDNASYKSLNRCARSIWKCYFSDGIDAIGFLRYCVVLSGLAGRFYMKGLKQSPDFVVCVIINLFPKVETLPVTWDTLHRVAESFVKKKTDESKSYFLDDLYRSSGPNSSECLDRDSGAENACECFRTELKGASFEEVYAMRQNALNDHTSKCLGGRRNNVSLNETDSIWMAQAYTTSFLTEESSTCFGDKSNYSEHRSGMSAILKIAAAATSPKKSDDRFGDQQVPDRINEYGSTHLSIEAADKEITLFAEDLVSYMMNKLLWKSTPYRSVSAAPRMGEYRLYVNTAFNGTIRRAVDILYDSVLSSIENEFNELAEFDKANYKSLKQFARNIWKYYFSDGIDAIGFLRYCVVLTGLAGRFYMNGVNWSADLVVCVIIKRFPVLETLSETWDTLHRAAERFVMEKKCESKPDFMDALKSSSKSNANECLDWVFGANGECECFNTDLKGSNFAEVYGMRNRALKYHAFKCLDSGRLIKSRKRSDLTRMADSPEAIPWSAESGKYLKGKHNYSKHRSRMSALLKIAAAATLSKKFDDIFEGDQVPDLMNESVIPAFTDKQIQDPWQFPEIYFPPGNGTETGLADRSMYSRLDPNISEYHLQIRESLIGFHVKSFFLEYKPLDNFNVRSEDSSGIEILHVQIPEMKDCTLAEVLNNSPVRNFEDTLPQFSRFQCSPLSFAEKDFPEQETFSSTSCQETALNIHPDIYLPGNSSAETTAYAEELKLRERRKLLAKYSLPFTHSYILDLLAQDRTSAQEKSPECSANLGEPSLEKPLSQKNSLENSEQRENPLDQEVSSLESSSELSGSDCSSD